MSEKPMDLNALREKMLKEKQEAPKTKEQEVTELRAKIEELENSPEEPSMVEVFQGLTPDEKQAEVNRLIAQGDRPSTYSIEDRTQELENAVAAAPFSSKREFRIDILKQQLAALESDTQN